MIPFCLSGLFCVRLFLVIDDDDDDDLMTRCEPSALGARHGEKKIQESRSGWSIPKHCTGVRMIPDCQLQCWRLAI